MTKEQLTPEKKAQAYIKELSTTPNTQTSILTVIRFSAGSTVELTERYNEWLLKNEYSEILFVTSMVEPTIYSSVNRFTLIVTYKKNVYAHDQINI